MSEAEILALLAKSISEEAVHRVEHITTRPFDHDVLVLEHMHKERCEHIVSELIDSLRKGCVRG